MAQVFMQVEDQEEAAQAKLAQASAIRVLLVEEEEATRQQEAHDTMGIFL